MVNIGHHQKHQRLKTTTQEMKNNHTILPKQEQTPELSTTPAQTAKERNGLRPEISLRIPPHVLSPLLRTTAEVTNH